MFYVDNYCMLTALGLAFMIALVLTPLFRDLAGRVGLVDPPDGRRKHQNAPVPRAGGLAIFFAVAGAILGLTLFGFDVAEIIKSQTQYVSLFAACLVIAIVGLLDDVYGFRGRHKLAGQFLAISVLVFYGHMSIRAFSLFGMLVDLGPMGVVLTYLWMIGIINAINLIDGMDGLLGIIGLLVCVSLALVGAITGNGYVAIVAAALAGALIGFLCFNLPPASVYLGDCGSMLIGLILGALSIQGSMKGPTAMALAVPLSILILPILDTLAAIARRKLTGRSIYTTDRGHLHHCLLRTGMNQPLVLGLVFVLGMIAIAGAVATTLLHHDVYSIAAAAVVVAILVMSRLFGYAEVMLIKAKFKALFALFRHGNHAGHSHQSEVRLQGSVRWQGIWEELTAAAFQYNLRTLCLDVNAPAMHEGYHARWDRFGSVHDEELHDWRADLPIYLDQRVIGRLSAVGICDSDPIWVKLQQLAEIVKTTELQIHRLIEHLSVSPVAPAPAFSKAIGAAS